MTATEMDNLISGFSVAEVRALILAHGETVQTDAGPTYKACHCELCEHARKHIAAQS